MFLLTVYIYIDMCSEDDEDATIKRQEKSNVVWRTLVVIHK